MLNCTWRILFVFRLQVPQGPDSSPFIRLMLTPTICPKPIPGMWHMHLLTHNMHEILIMITKNNTYQSLVASFVWTPYLSLLSSFNRIDIPPYESYDKLYDKLLTAIEETCGFAVEWETHCRVCLCVNRCICVQDPDRRLLSLQRATGLTQSLIRASLTSLQSSSSLTALHILPSSIICLNSC